MMEKKSAYLPDVTEKLDGPTEDEWDNEKEKFIRAMNLAKDKIAHPADLGKPSLLDVLQIMMLKDYANALYAEIDRQINMLHTLYGTGRFDYHLNINPDCESYPALDYGKELQEKGSYLKFEIEDNLAKAQAGETVWKSVEFKALSFSSRVLKNCPESLKEIEKSDS